MSATLYPEDRETLDLYLRSVFSAFRLGAWRHDRARAEIEETMTRALSGDAAVIDHMESVIRTLGDDLMRFGDYEPPEDEPAPAAHPVNRPAAPGEGRTLELAAHSDAGGSVATSLHLSAEGAIRVERFDHGAASEAALGGDSRHWVEVAPEYAPAVAFVLLGDLMRGKLDAVPRLDEFCTRWRIPCRERREA